MVHYLPKKKRDYDALTEMGRDNFQSQFGSQRKHLYKLSYQQQDKPLTKWTPGIQKTKEIHSKRCKLHLADGN